MSRLRSSLVGPLGAAAGDGQYGGGCNSGSTGVAHLKARTFSGVALTLSSCLVQFFLDVKTAFAAM
eukprot:4064081-Karenia_brevis.AAC.1